MGRATRAPVGNVKRNAPSDQERIMKILILLLLSALCSPSWASYYPSPCDSDKRGWVYSESSIFVQAPSRFAGCVGAVPGAAVGIVAGIPFGNPAAGASIGAIAFDLLFQGLVGAPFYALEYYPRKWLSADETSSQESTASDQVQ